MVTFMETPPPVPEVAVQTHLPLPSQASNADHWEVNHLPKPQIFRPFQRQQERALLRHITEIRKAFDAPGVPYHDALEPDGNRFNRWHWHNLPALVQLHHDYLFVTKVCRMLGLKLKPSYAFLSMYGRNGICPPHTDRPQCAVTVDYCISSDAKERPWPLIIDNQPYTLQPGEAVLYSGTQQLHYREYLENSSDATFCNLAFFHFVPTSFVGPLA